MAELCGLEFSEKMVPTKEDEVPLGSKARKKWYPIRENVNLRYEKEMTNEAKNIIKKEIQSIDKKTCYS